MRMFVAVVPPTEVVEAVEEFLEPRRGSEPALRWTEPYQWHVTLAFLPEVGARALDDLVERLSRAAARRPSFPVTLAGAGAFPDPAHTRVLWIGATSVPAEALGQLSTGVRAAANKAGAVVEGGRFRAHLTLARVRKPEDSTRWLRVIDTLGPLTWPAESIQLIQSHLGQGRDGHPRYDLLASHPLGVSAASQ